MPSLRLRLVALFVLLSLAVAAVMIAAVQFFSSDQIMRLAMASGRSAAEAQAMFDEYVGRVLLVGAAAGVLLGVFAAWWLLRRILHPLERLTDATRAIASGDLATRVHEPADPELRRLATSFNQMAIALERAEQLRRSLVEDVAHELRTPLTSLQGYTEALADGVAEPTPEMLRTIHEEIMRLTRLVQGLDQLARGALADGLQLTATPVRVDLAAAALRAIEIHSAELASRHISTHLADGAKVPRVLADPDGIGQVLGNLMQNAARYTEHGGTVIVRLSASDATVRCTVQNTGPQIPAEELPYIWERLYRVDRSRARASGGAGIGLAIVRQIVEAHGGRAGASSTPGQTEIWFELPIDA